MQAKLRGFISQVQSATAAQLNAAFQALLYPAISHDMNLSKETPPAFLACGENDREDIAQGAADLGVDLDEHIQFVIDALTTIAAELDLAGQTGGSP